MAVWAGAAVDDRLAAQLDQVAVLVPPGTILRPTQGSWSGGESASGGTHDQGGAIDLAGQDPGMDPAMCDAIRDAMRQVGIAAWVRDPSQSDWSWHVHGISVQPGGRYDQGCLSYAAWEQVEDYYAGRNGLASGAPDDGPRQWVGVTWETYLADQGDDMTPEQAAQLTAIQGKVDQMYWLVEQVKPQTDRLPRINATTDQVNWGVNDAADGLRVMVANVQMSVNAVLDTLGAAQTAVAAYLATPPLDTFETGPYPDDTPPPP